MQAVDGEEVAREWGKKKLFKVVVLESRTRRTTTNNSNNKTGELCAARVQSIKRTCEEANAQSLSRLHIQQLGTCYNFVLPFGLNRSDLYLGNELVQRTTRTNRVWKRELNNRK